MSGTEQEDPEARIRERAHALWEEEGRPEGRAEEHWERARRLVEAEEEPKRPDMVADPPL